MDINKEKILFSTTDPIGRNIVLKESTWNAHIANRHSEKEIEEIKRNIESPNIIIENNRSTTSEKKREVYLKLTTINNTVINLKTVVEFDDDNRNGEVVTNYLLRKLKETVPEGGIIYDCTSNIYR